MPLNSNLDINYTPLQETTTRTALDDAKTEIQAVIGSPLNLSTEERKAPSVDEQRESYVRKAIEDLGIQYPGLLGPEISLARATKLWQFRNTSLTMLSRVNAIRDLLIDSIVNSENLCLKFTEDLRDNAGRYKDRNYPGADVVWEELKDLHTVTISEPEPTPP